jgi:hypothetical protein
MNTKRKLEQILINEISPFIPKDPLTDNEKEGIILAVKSAFLKLKNLYSQIVPIFIE